MKQSQICLPHRTSCEPKSPVKHPSFNNLVEMRRVDLLAVVVATWALNQWDGHVKQLHSWTGSLARPRGKQNPNNSIDIKELLSYLLSSVNP